ncbi:MAG: hypothetical protein HC937_04085, partial [Aquincola sp.]|nr:hypothetical protein [Aquincola sp.]
MAAFGILFAVLPTQGEVIILRDGYALHGKVGSEQENVSDPNTGLLIPVKKAAGFMRAPYTPPPLQAVTRGFPLTHHNVFFSRVLCDEFRAIFAQSAVPGEAEPTQRGQQHIRH